MKNCLLLLIILVSGVTVLFAQDTLIIQETDAIGLCTFDGTIMNNLTGTTNGSYIDAASGIGTTVSWEILVPANGIYAFSWKYSFGGTSTNYRDAKLVIDGNVSVDTVYFPYTGAWTTWAVLTPVNINLTAGDHKVRLEAVRTSGLANLDYFMVIGTAPTAATCTPQYVINVKSDSSVWGSVWFSPIKTYYDKGTLVTMHAIANPGYFFQCWTGEETSADTAYTFAVKSNVNAIARFLPNSIQLDTTVIGYASVEDDRGTPYWVFGGTMGDTVTASSTAELQTYLGSTLPYVVKFSGYLVGTEQISIKSNKTLLGIGDTAHLEGIGLSINQARNIILRNISIAHVCTTGAANGDGIEINGASKNIVIDHCEISSDRNNGVDYYDGALDIKNGSTFITVSWSAFHDHYKVSLISSGDTQYGDTVIRATYHHNYFYNCGSRLPSIRFGRAHIFNNYYLNSDDAVNSRMDAWVRVERNYFENVGTAVMTAYSPIVGRVQLIDNVFGSSSIVTSPTCDLQVPYPYTLDPTDSIPSIVTNNVKTAIDNNNMPQIPEKFSLEQNYPNPFNPVTVINYQLPAVGTRFIVSLKVFDLLGREVATLVNEQKAAGNYSVPFDASKLASGVYFYQLKAGSYIQTKKMLLLR